MLKFGPFAHNKADYRVAIASKLSLVNVNTLMLL